MKCSRCQGLMIRDHFLDFDGTTGHMWANGFRCMNCGNVHDPIIEQHRLAQRPNAMTLKNTEIEFKLGELDEEFQEEILRAA